MPGRFDLHFYTGSDYAEAITFRDETGAIIDVSQRTFRAQVRDMPGGTLLATLNIDMADAEDGVIVLSLPASVTATATGGVWDLVQTVGAFQTALLHGRVRVTQGVTR